MDVGAYPFENLGFRAVPGQSRSSKGEGSPIRGHADGTLLTNWSPSSRSRRSDTRG
jgi:hypothetical protein